MRRGDAIPVALAIGVATLTAATPCEAQGCAPGAYEAIGITSGIALGSGAAGALGAAGILAEADDTRDFSFSFGAGVGIAVAAGLTGLFAVVDSTAGCGMSNDSQPVVWSVPIVTFIVGAALPLALWGASDEINTTSTDQQALVTPPRPLQFRASWKF